MILYTENGDKMKCLKCKAPKLNSNKVWYTSIRGKIDEDDVHFFYNTSNSSSRFYFYLDKQWYYSAMMNEDGVNIFYYIYNLGKKLYTKKREGL